MTRLKAFAAQLGQGPLPWLFGIAAMGLVLHVIQSSDSGLMMLRAQSSPPQFLEASRLNGLISMVSLLFWGWLVMLLMMMPQLVSPQVSYVWQSSLRRRRIGSVAIFGLAYMLVWLVAGLVLVPVALIIPIVFAPGWAPFLVLALALIWSASPLAQAARNRCHRVRRIGVFGRRAYMECFQQGLDTGFNCFATCWPWMILPMTAMPLHLAAMVAVAIYIFAERLSPATTVRWRMPPGISTLHPRPQRLSLPSKLDSPPFHR